MSQGFATLGNVTIDDLVFDDGTTKWRTPGGNAIYSALGVAIWGHLVEVVAPIGADYPVELLDRRVSLDRCTPVAETLRDWGLYEADGSRIFVFRRHVRDWRDYSPRLEDIRDLAARCAHLAPLPWDLQLDLALGLRERGTRVIAVDPDDRKLAEVPPAQIARLLRAVDLFLPSLQDAAAMLPEGPPADMLRRLRERAPETPVVAIKLGAEGVILHERDAPDYVRIPSCAGRVVDATGAGDAFSGGALVGFATRGTALAAGLHGSVAASFAVAAHGPDALVAATDEDVAERLNILRERVETHPL
ncbi:carbohydrate/pyrimidine kinase, PfkB family protein [Oceanicola granulosus HTCC2516]|uniref:Carbohydrate/pyrimidine kinase, PfkB family protein n=1 Tax=Oceanicola granulosus (strain ATCC BAA-861 / DSM 15982 / KCTC 12143 / HTCC2516) TaxID=314256 RepID=Q2CH83_OCEGH|nr:PfkB family carbohydrate kinase [Oceanicola granulosus]EAR51928.1 carbohydrate/pyrimidine kinase, PfkB family protein [Oceanicola granulosus HTCC2516]